MLCRLYTAVKGTDTQAQPVLTGIFVSTGVEDAQECFALGESPDRIVQVSISVAVAGNHPADAAGNQLRIELIELSDPAAPGLREFEDDQFPTGFEDAQH